jgi:hypothetical protein
MKSAIYAILFLTVGFIFGCFAIELVAQRHIFAFDPKISLGEIVDAGTNLLVAVLVTVLVTHYLEKQNQAEQKEKEILLRQLDLILPLVQEFEKSNESGDLTAIQSSLKRISVSCNLFNKAVKKLNYPAKILEETDFSILIADLRKLATETPIKEIEDFANHRKCTASVKNGIISLTIARKALLEGKIDELKSKLFSVQMMVNRK